MIQEKINILLVEDNKADAVLIERQINKILSFPKILHVTNFKDFEDGIQYYTALEAQCELIVTRNLKDFKKSTIPVMSPKEYLTKLQAE